MIYKNNNTFYITNEGGLMRCDCEMDNKVLFLSNLIVNENERNRHYGTKIIKEAITMAKNLDCDTVSLEVDEDCKWLINWYKRLGFMVVGYGYQEKRILMSRIVNFKNIRKEFLMDFL